MILRSKLLPFAAFAIMAQPSYADDALAQTTISFYADGKPVGGIIFPIGVKVQTAAVANRIDRDEKGIHFKGNVEAGLTPSAGQPVALFGDEVVVTKEGISPERAKAVQDIDAMLGPDQLYRGRSATAELTPDEWKRQTEIDRANMKRLGEIIDAFGWPGLHFAGAASRNAFLVLQHADNANQRNYLPLLRDAVKRNDALGADLALLEDRVRVADGKPQLYGSQLSGKPLRFNPIEDESHVDERRRSIGLMPMAEYAKLFGLTYPMPQ